MLFRPANGPELEVVYSFIAQSPTPVSRQAIYQACLPYYVDKRTVAVQGVDDAISFLVAAMLIEDRSGFRLCVSERGNSSFRLTAIAQMQKLANREVTPIHELDTLYFLLLRELFIVPDRLFVGDVHAEANKLRPVTELGESVRKKSVPGNG